MGPVVKGQVENRFQHLKNIQVCNKKNEGLKTYRRRKCLNGKKILSPGCQGGPPLKKQIKRCPKWNSDTTGTPKECVLVSLYSRNLKVIQVHEKVSITRAHERLHGLLPDQSHGQLQSQS